VNNKIRHVGKNYKITIGLQESNQIQQKTKNVIHCIVVKFSGYKVRVFVPGYKCSLITAFVGLCDFYWSL